MASPSPTPSSSAAVVTKTVAATVGQTFTTAFAPAPSKAPGQSVLDPNHIAPNAVNTNDPIVLFIIQAGIILIMSRLLAVGLKRLRQPAVISEVIGGIILGPSVFGQIDGYMENIFPVASQSYLNLVATIGLTLFLFLVGLETDFRILSTNWKKCSSISLVGMVIPFGLGAAVSKGLYDKFIDQDKVKYSHFMLFVGVAMAITAFPVLARILTELQLLHDHVGVTVLGAGVGNDVVGWILLALSVALVNSSGGLVTVYVLLVALGLILFIFIILKPIYLWYLRKTGNEEKPSQMVMAVTMLLVFGAAFLTDIIGIHPIFGSFLIGLMCPHEHGFASAMTEKIEDLITVLFIPIYFALSGLRTDLSLLKNGSIWGWCICVIVVAFCSKFIGCAITAKLCGYKLRESLAVGSLMSCKGLVELIVLNIGLQAGILNEEVFAMFVVMAIVTTVSTTPLTLAFYPPEYRLQREMERAGGQPGKKGDVGPSHGPSSGSDSADHVRTRFLVALERIDHLAPAMVLSKLFQVPGSNKLTASTGSLTPTKEYASEEDQKDGLDPPIAELPKSSQPALASGPTTKAQPISIEAVRLLELDERTSAVMKASEQQPQDDPLCTIFSAFAHLNGMDVRTSLELVSNESFASTISTHASVHDSDMVVIPWTLAASAPAGGPDSTSISLHNPFDSIFGTSNKRSNPQYASYVRRIMADSSLDVGLFVDRGFAGHVRTADPSKKTHVFFPFFGGKDDREALSLVLQLCRSPEVTATVLRVIRSAEPTPEDELATTKSAGSIDKDAQTEVPALLSQYTVHAGGPTADTVYGHLDTQTQLQSATADELYLNEIFPDSDSNDKRSPAVKAAASRITFETVKAFKPLHTVIERASRITSHSHSTLIVAGRSRRGGGESHEAELATLLKETVTGDSLASAGGLSNLGIAASSEVRKTLGGVGSAVIVSPHAGTGLLVVQAAETSAAVRKDA